MFDQTPDTIETKHWTKRLRKGDVVIYRFPLVAAKADEGPKKRPCLVLDVFEQDGRPHARVAYGTRVMTRRSATDINLQHPGALFRAGVREPTRFERSRSIAVRLNDAGFAASTRLGTAITGCVSERTISTAAQRRGYLRMQR